MRSILRSVCVVSLVTCLAPSPAHAEGQLLAGELRFAVGDDLLIETLDFVDIHAAELGLTAPWQELTALPETTWEGGQILRFNQTHAGVPVMGASVTASWSPAGTLLSVASAVEEDIEVATKPKISVEEAEATLTKAIGTNKLDRVSPATLVIERDAKGGHRLVYRKVFQAMVPGEEKGTVEPWFRALVLDAMTGELLDDRDLLHDCDDVTGNVVTGLSRVVADHLGTDAVVESVKTCEGFWSDTWFLEDHTRDCVVETYDMRGQTFDNTVIWSAGLGDMPYYAYNRGDNWWTTGDDGFEGVAAEAHMNAGKALDFFSSVYGRDGYDDDGGDLDMAVGYNKKKASSGWGTLFFGKGHQVPGMGTLDIVTHEMGHLVSYYDYLDDGVFYGDPAGEGEPGAVNEHLSDLLGIFAVSWAGIIGPEEQRWVFGALQFPVTYLDNWQDPQWRTKLKGVRNYITGQRKGSKKDVRVHMAHWKTDSTDGGVHRNATILGKAAHLMTFGGQNAELPGFTYTTNGSAVDPTFDDDLEIEVQPLGEAFVRKVVYRTLRTKLTRHTDFAGFAEGMAASCWEIVDTEPVWDPWKCVSLQNAYVAVGVLPNDRADRDYDGVPDTADTCPELPNTNAQQDSDGDGFGDVCDICPTAADPNQGDHDGDGLGDACDIDDDNDGRWDIFDNCPLTPNGNQHDAEGDGVGDACDADDDNDGVLDGADNCVTLHNPGQGDNDGDGWGDVCDLDDDGDGRLDFLDNCPTAPNSDQADLDGDGLGDACDGDRDADGVHNWQDNCPDDANPGQHDIDLDGEGDVCDTVAALDGIEDKPDLTPKPPTWELPEPWWKD